MRKIANKEVGDEARFEISFDPNERVVPIHFKLQEVLEKNEEAFKVFNMLPKYLQLEIKRYFANLKTEATVEKNRIRGINFY